MCQVYTKKEAYKLVFDKGASFQNFRYKCCDKGILEKGEHICEHTEISPENLQMFSALTDPSPHDQL